MTARILTIGSALQDIYLVDHDDLKPTSIGDSAIFGKVLVGSKVDIDKLYYTVGGGGINAAVTFARNGFETIFMGNVGDDSAGNAVFNLLDEENIDNSYVSVLRGTTGTSVILLDSQGGERTILTHRGTSAKFDNLDEKDLDLIQPDWIYITTLRGDMATLERILKKAREIGARVMLNPGIKELGENKKLLWLLKYVSVLILNKSEAAKLVPGVLLEELLYHLSSYIPVTIITDGAMGGIAGSNREIYRFGIYEDTKIKDATGAGDAFGSGFLAAMLSGKKFKDALIFASANSTAVVSKIGANQGILTNDKKLHMMPIQKI